MKYRSLLIIFFLLGQFSSSLFGQDTIVVQYGDSIKMEKTTVQYLTVFKLRQGLPDGFYKVVYKNVSNTWYGGKIENGQQNGKWTKFSLGKLESQYYYNKGELLKDKVDYYENGQIKAKVIDSLHVGYSFYEDTILNEIAIRGFVVNVLFYKDQSIRSIQYFNKEKELSIVIKYNQNGQKVSREVADLVTNKHYTTTYDGNGSVTGESVFPLD
jgi:antitoxin component YwqK of YwqJK toxin-antitoxin module